MAKGCAAAFLLLLIGLSGCSSAQESEVSHVAEQLHAALKNEDGAAACDLLSDDAQEQLQEAEGSSCEVAILETGLNLNGRIEKVEVFGTAGQVRYDDDVVFLADYPDGWKVIGAGCEKQAAEPYDCQIQGG